MSKREAKPGDIWAYKDRSAVFIVTGDICLLRIYTEASLVGKVEDREKSITIFRNSSLEYIGTFTELDSNFWRRVLP